jgi:hypothetical protein
MRKLFSSVSTKRTEYCGWTQPHYGHHHIAKSTGSREAADRPAPQAFAPDVAAGNIFAASAHARAASRAVAWSTELSRGVVPQEADIDWKDAQQREVHRLRLVTPHTAQGGAGHCSRCHIPRTALGCPWSSYARVVYPLTFVTV